MAKNKRGGQTIQPTKKEISDSKLHKYLIAIPILALLIKLITMVNIPNGGWYGADGENYMAGVEGLLNKGFFSDEPLLSYWPAGYPLLLWPLAALSVSKVYFLLSVIQSIFFAFSTYFFTNKLRNSSLKFLAFWGSVLVSFNPTLSLSSLSVGYEAPIASCFLMIAGTILSTFNQPIDRKFWVAVASVGGWFALATFMQPRFSLIAIITAIMWAFKIVGPRNRIRLSALIIALMMIAPGIMIFRNSVSIDKATISTNLGATMRIGAGPETSGAYSRTGPEVPCEPKTPTSVVSDNELVFCVLKWYLANPLDTARLSFNKAIYFWSPWSGPEATGTMARNPWLKISPVQQIGESNKDGQGLIFSRFGVALSYLWIFGQVLLLGLGHRTIRKLGNDEKFFARVLVTPVLVSWILALGTIGDHRFRVPTMSMSITLQTAALLAVRKKLNEKVG